MGLSQQGIWSIFGLLEEEDLVEFEWCTELHGLWAVGLVLGLVCALLLEVVGDRFLGHRCVLLARSKSLDFEH